MKSATGALSWSLTYVFPDRFTVVVQLHSVVASVGPLVEADGHALGDAVLADAAAHVIPTQIHAQPVRASTVAAVHLKLSSEVTRRAHVRQSHKSGSSLRIFKRCELQHAPADVARHTRGCR